LHFVFDYFFVFNYIYNFGFSFPFFCSKCNIINRIHHCPCKDVCCFVCRNCERNILIFKCRLYCIEPSTGITLLNEEILISRLDKL
jgi:hypothetical protein